MARAIIQEGGKEVIPKSITVFGEEYFIDPETKEVIITDKDGKELARTPYANPRSATEKISYNFGGWDDIPTKANEIDFGKLIEILYGLRYRTGTTRKGDIRHPMSWTTMYREMGYPNPDKTKTLAVYGKTVNAIKANDLAGTDATDSGANIPTREAFVEKEYKDWLGAELELITDPNQRGYEKGKKKKYLKLTNDEGKYRTDTGELVDQYLATLALDSGFSHPPKMTDSKRPTQKYKNAKRDLYTFFHNWAKKSPREFMHIGSKISPSEKKKKITEEAFKLREEFWAKGLAHHTDPVKIIEDKKGNKINVGGLGMSRESYRGGQWKNVVGNVRLFAEKVAEIPIGKTPAGNPFSQDVKTAGFGGKSLAGRYAGLKADPKQITDIEVCLQERKYKDAYFLFLLNKELGLREKEAMTITTNANTKSGTGAGLKETEMDFPRIDPKTEKPITDDEGNLLYDTRKIYRVFVKTRKGDWHGKGRHSALVMDEKLINLINNRLLEIKKGIGISPDAPKTDGGIAHSLIGNDDEYYAVKSLDLPEPVQRGKQQKNLKRLADQLRQCYEDAQLSEAYWTKKPFHSMRHIFAQYWLAKTGWDVSFVADLGHWATPSELIRSYGEQDDDLYATKQMLYHSEAYLTIPEQKRKMEAEKHGAKFKKDIEEIVDAQKEAKEKLKVQREDVLNVEFDIPEGVVITPTGTAGSEPL